MPLKSKHVQVLNTCKAILGLFNFLKKSHIKTLVLLSFITMSSSIFAADGSHLVAQATKKMASQEVEALVEKLRPEAVAVRKDGDTIRMRYLRGAKDLPDTVREIQTRPLKLFKNGKSAVMGPGSSGGGFSNYYSSYASMIDDVNAMIGQFERMPEVVLKNYLPSNYHDKITAKKISQALRNIQFSFFQEGISIAPEGLTDILEADYVLDGDNSYIILLKSFFEKYNSMERSNSLSIMRARTILHEITHLFGVGLTDDSKSLELSFYLVLALNSDQRPCISTADCKAPVELLSRQYEMLNDDLLQMHKKAIQEKFNISNLQLNGAIFHGYSSSISSLGRWTPKNLEGSGQSVFLLTSYELKNILPKDFAKIETNRFATELLASISGQAFITYENYLSLFENKKSRWGSYELVLLESEDGTLYSKFFKDSLTITSGSDNKITEFLSGRGTCYGEKLERPNYKWTYDEQSQICVGRK